MHSIIGAILLMLLAYCINVHIEIDFLVRGDIHTHVTLLSINLKLIDLTPTLYHLMSAVAIKFILANFLIFRQNCCT